MKLTLNRLKDVGREVERGWPGYLFGGHVRTSTVVLIVLFLAVWWLYDTYRPATQPSSQVPTNQVVPPGFVPDPNYTWVPRSRLQEPPPVVTPTPTTTPPQPPATNPTTATTSPPPLFQLPVLPPLPPPVSPGPTTPPPPGPAPFPGLPPG